MLHLTVAELFKRYIEKGKNLVGRADETYFAKLVEQAGNMGIAFMQLKNATVNEVLRDGKYVCDTARKQL